MQESVGSLGAVVFGASATITLVGSFPYWRRGLAEIGVSEGWSWPLAATGSLVLLAAVLVVPYFCRIMLKDDIVWPTLVALPLAIALGWVYMTVLGRGGAPLWMREPPELYELVWNDMPTPVKWLVGLLASLVGVASANRR